MTFVQGLKVAWRPGWIAAWIFVGVLASLLYGLNLDAQTLSADNIRTSSAALTPARTVDQCIELYGTKSVPECKRLQRDARSSQQRLSRSSDHNVGRLLGLAETPTGVVRRTATYGGTALGLALILIMFAAVYGREWERGVVAIRVVRLGSRWSYITRSVVGAAGLLTGAFVIFALSGAIGGGIAALVTHMRYDNLPASHATSVATAARSLIGMLVIWSLGAAVGMAAGALVRTAINAVLIGFSALILLIATVLAPATSSAAYWIASTLNIDTTNQDIVEYVWPSRFLVRHMEPHLAAVSVTLLATVVVYALMSWWIVGSRSLVRGATAGS